jgi:hypothetical protein
VLHAGRKTVALAGGESSVSGSELRICSRVWAVY